MKITNKYNLPEPLVRAILNDPYEHAGDISVTTLIGPPRIRILRKRHDDQIIEDVSDRIWAFLGQVGHALLERAKIADALQEERLYTTIMGWKVTGQSDLLSADKTLTDYKVTSAWSIIFGDKSEWERQLNCYRFLYSTYGFNVDHLQVVAILRDWSKRKALYEKGYPECQVAVVPIPLWPLENAHKYLTDRVALHQLAETLPDHNLPYCSPEERWERPTQYAVMKDKRKTALRVLESEQDAIRWMVEKGHAAYSDDHTLNRAMGINVVRRPGKSVRCEDGWCIVSQFCNQYKRMKGETYGSHGE